MTNVPIEPAPEPPAPVAESDLVNAAKGAARSFLIVFVTMWIPAVLNFLNELMGWANEGGQAPFPEISQLGYLGIAAIMGGIAAAVTFLLRWAENTLGVGILRSSLPTDNDGNDNGDGEVTLIVKVLLLILLIVVVIWVLMALFGGNGFGK